MAKKLSSTDTDATMLDKTFNMGLETFYTKTATIKRQTYVGDKSTFASVGTIKGHLRPLNETQASANGFQFGQIFAFQTAPDADIRESDTVEIDGVEYTCNGVATHDRPPQAVAHKRALLLLPETS